MTATIRLATDGDAATVAAIYGPYCESSPVSFETQPPSAEGMAQRIRTTAAEWPWLVLDTGVSVAGYAYACRHRERAAYRWAVDTAVYVSPHHRRRGVARALYTTLLDILRQQGYFKACAGITLPNLASVGLHEAVGFRLVGVYRGIGYKLGSWHDVAWYEVEVQPESESPSSPQPVSALLGSVGWQEAVARGLAHYADER